MKDDDIFEKIIGLILLFPPIVAVVCFTLSNLGVDWNWVQLRHLSANWTGDNNAMSAAPIFLGLMAIAGAILFKKK